MLELGWDGKSGDAGETSSGRGSDVASHGERVGSRAHVMRVIEEQCPGADARDCEGVFSGGSCPAPRPRVRRPVRPSAVAANAVATMTANARMGRMMGPKPLHRRSIGRSICVLEAPRRGCAILVRTVTQVTFRILGPLEALVDGRHVDLSSRRERALLGVLLLHFGEVVSVDALVDSVWGEQAPASARHMVHEYVSRLRGALGDASVIVTRAPGYIVERDACDLDAARFAELLRHGALRGRRASSTRR